jgi:hypothetical protein
MKPEAEIESVLVAVTAGGAYGSFLSRLQWTWDLRGFGNEVLIRSYGWPTIFFYKDIEQRSGVWLVHNLAINSALCAMLTWSAAVCLYRLLRTLRTGGISSIRTLFIGTVAAALVYPLWKLVSLLTLQGFPPWGMVLDGTKPTLDLVSMVVVGLFCLSFVAVSAGTRFANRR